MTKEELIDVAYERNKTAKIGSREFDCLITIIEYGQVTTLAELDEYIPPKPLLSYKIEQDGDQWRATTNEFINLMESDCYAFGATPAMALNALLKKLTKE